jgi:exonuclease SbcC
MMKLNESLEKEKREMKLKQLRARGFIGFKRGLDLDEISVDLSGLSGLVALTGQNGTGKSSMLELLHPYRRLASRTGNLKNHVFLRDSFKELTFDFNGSEYRTLIKIDCDSDRSEGFIFRNGESLVNGKLKEYDKKVNELFGSPELFFSSVFTAQNAAKLSDMTTGQLKGLFSEFLQLDKLEAYEKTAKQAGGIVAGLVAGKQREADRLQGQDVKMIEHQVRDLNVLISESMVLIDGTGARIAEQESRATMARAAAGENAVIMQKIEGLKNEHRAAMTAGRQYTDTVNAELDVMRTKCTAVLQELLRAEVLAGQQEAVSMAAYDMAILKAVEPQKRESIAETDAKINALRDDLHALQNTHNEANRALESAKYNPKQAALHVELTACRKNSTVLTKRSPTCTDPKCALIASAVEAADRIPALEAQQKELTAILDDEKAKAESIMQDCILKTETLTRDKQGYEDLLKQSRADLAENMAKQAELEILLKQSGDIAAAVERKASIEARIAELKATGIAKKSALENRQQIDSENICRLEQLIADTESALDLHATGALKSAESEIAVLKNTKHDAEQQLISLQGQREAVTLKLAEARAAEKKLAGLNSETAELQREAAEWLYIQAACGANGLRALEIDGVAPCITGYANALLSETYGPSFSVRLRTQDEETGKECFDIIVCNDSGEETPLENLSGGQKCWLLMALRLAMTLISKEKSGIKFDTAFADEIDGALDVENAKTFASMYRAFMTAGGMDSLFFITHKPECTCLSDRQIIFSENGITIN